MKVALFIASSGWGGAEKLFLTLCNELAKNQDVTVLTFENPSITKHLDERIKVVTLPKKGRRNPILYWHVFKAIKSSSFAVIHTHGGKATQIVYNLSRFIGLNQIATKHNPRKGLVFRKIRWVTAVSEGVANSIREGTPIIYNGIDPKPAKVSENRNERLTIIAIGRLDPIKGYDILIEQVSKLEIDFCLNIVGEGPHEAKLRHKINTLKLQGKVSLLGYRRDIPKLMGESDLTVIASYSEGFSLVVVESMFYAKVVLSTRVGGAIELLDEDFMCDQNQLADNITRIASDYPNYREKFKLIQERNREILTIDVTAKTYISFYKKSLS